MPQQKFLCIDFEATEFGECISIGAINDKKRFYSLVKPKKLKNVTPRIVALTNINQKDLENARVPDIVFNKFRDWAPNGYKFFCYGNYDKRIVQKTCMQPEFKGYICKRLIDVSKPLSTVLGCKKNELFSLKKCYELLFDEIEQKHNALGDAKILQKICEKICEMTDIELFTFGFNNLGIKEISKDMSNEDFASLNRLLAAMTTLRGYNVSLKHIKGLFREYEKSYKELLTN